MTLMSLRILRTVFFFLLLVMFFLVFLGSLYVQSRYNNYSSTPADVDTHVTYALEQSTKENSASSNLTFKILYWTLSSGRQQNWFGSGQEPFRHCNFSNCELTANKEELNGSDAVLFYMYYLDSFPEHRFPWQKWIMKIHESPINEDHRDYARYNNVFNATWTYSSKSDINSHVYLKRFVPIQESGNLTQINYGASKTRMAVWFVSKCDSKSKREAYFSKLYKYINIDIYGRCGTFDCKRMAKDCDNLLMTKGYRFYLAFENSICDEYVTEKLWRPLEHNTIPIVLGGANYSDILPPHSYIDVADFPSPKDLADYLILLSVNEALYNAYFEWQKYLKITTYGPQVCELCEYLNRYVGVGRIYTRLDLFWNAKTDCRTPEEHYRNVSKDTWEIKKVYRYS